MTAGDTAPTLADALAQLNAELEEADAQLRWAQGRYDELVRMRDGLIAARAEYGEDEP